MAKFLKVIYPENCIGCELCVAETQRQLKKVGLDGALIRIFKERKGHQYSIKYSIELDPYLNNLDMEKIRDICPRLVFTLEEQGEEENGLVA